PPHQRCAAAGAAAAAQPATAEAPRADRVAHLRARCPRHTAPLGVAARRRFVCPLCPTNAAAFHHVHAQEEPDRYLLVPLSRCVRSCGWTTSAALVRSGIGLSR